MPAFIRRYFAVQICLFNDYYGFRIILLWIASTTQKIRKLEATIVQKIEKRKCLMMRQKSDSDSDLNENARCTETNDDDDFDYNYDDGNVFDEEKIMNDIKIEVDIYNAKSTYHQKLYMISHLNFFFP